MTRNNTEYDLDKEEYNITHTENASDSGSDNGTPGSEPDSYSIEDDEPDGSHSDGSHSGPEGETEKPKRPNPILLLLSMMVNPVDGWKQIRRARFKPEEIASRCFYPLTAVAAVSEFIGLIYGNDHEINTVLVEALTVFIAFFFGYFLVQLLEKIILPKECRDAADSDFGKSFVMLMLSTLALFYTLSNAAPMLEAVWVFLPLWTIYLASKGVKYFKFPDHRSTMLTVLMCSIIILAPIAVYMLFTELLAI